ncbi:MAG TPA: hypothetical protein VEA44_17420 [Caulobacter sp.]|nr:hypothetical protein [Caulobacter sp.]
MNFPALFDITTIFAQGGGGALGLFNGHALGSAVAGGDINGDGYQDVIVSGLGAAPNGAASGATYVLFGSAAGLPALDLSNLNGADGFVINGAAAGDLSGYSLATGDFNGDGYDDLAIGAPGHNGEGAAYLVYGKAGGFTATLELSALDGTDGFKFVTFAPGGAGAAVSLGDVNGDGLADLLVGAPDQDDYGAVHITFGHAAPRAAVVTPGLGVTRGFSLVGASYDSDAGFGLGTADLNGDGIGDILVGAPGSSTDQDWQGAVFVVNGMASGHPELIFLHPASVNHVAGALENDFVGRPVTSAGDVNGDGIEDMIIGAPRSPSGAHLGGAYVVFGRPGGIGASLDLATLDGSDGFLITAAQLYASAGASVAAAGDIDGDGYGDLIIGAPQSTGLGYGQITGEAYVLYGKASFDSGVIYPDLFNGHNGFRIIAPQRDTLTGAAVAGAGDINGDGFDDLIVGSPRENGAGVVYVIYGRIRDQADVGGSGADRLSGHLGEDVLSGMDGDDRLSGGGADDALDGGLGHDLLDGGTGADAMDGGAGDDTYIVDDLSDTATEAGGGGADRVRASVSFTLGADLENLVLEGTADIDGTGNALANVLDGNSGANILSGGGGADLIKGGAGDDVLDGGTGGDQLLGGIGTDVLDGAGDNDRLEGGDGDDTILGGTGADILDGGADNDALTGGAGADQLLGGAGTDTLDGGSENDVLHGGTGADAMTGGTGDDTFHVDDAGDSTVEALGEGTDVVRAGLTWTLGANLERLVLDGSADIDGAGNGLANVLTGNGGANRLDGGGGADIINGGLGADTVIGGTGADILSGGGGADTFVVRQESVYSSLVPAGQTLEADTVSDFSAGQSDGVDLSAIDAIAGGPDDAFALVGAFSGAAGQMTLTFAAGTTTLALDIDGDQRADYLMRINGDVRAESGGWLL